VRKYEFVLGKYLGLSLMLLVNLVVMALIFLGYHWIMISRPQFGLVTAVFLIYLEVAFVTAIAMMFGSVASPILSAVFTFVMFFAGHFADAYMLLAQRGKHLGQPLMKHFFLFLYWVMPNLTFFDRKNEAVHQLPIATSDVALACAYCVIYSTILLIVSLYAFKRKNF
jgi:ABC-type transport system involved in multi-copper enzyme maturation permease subunit